MDARRERGRMLVEESREIVVVLDEDGRVVAASRRAREALDGLERASSLPDDLPPRRARPVPFTVPYEVAGRHETLVYLHRAGRPGRLRGAARRVHRGRLARAADAARPHPRAARDRGAARARTRDDLVEQAQAEVEQIRELIDDVLFLAELETGREVVALGATPSCPILHEVARSCADRPRGPGSTLAVEGDEEVELPLRPRMLRVVAENLAENAIRYAGPGATFTLSVRREDGERRARGSDDGVGVDAADLPRLFERFYRADRARASRGTGLGLAIVKHVVTSAGGTVEASGGRGHGLEIRCSFPCA